MQPVPSVQICCRRESAMTDLFMFTALRSPRRAEPHDDFTLATEWYEVDPLIHTDVVRREWRGENLIPQLRLLVVYSDNPSADGRRLAESFLLERTAITLETLRGGADPAALADNEQDIPMPGAVGLALLDRLDRWLVTEDNRPRPHELDDWLRASVAELDEPMAEPNDPKGSDPNDPKGSGTNDPPMPTLIIEQRRFLHSLLGPTWSRLVDSLAAALLIPNEGELAQRLTRLLLVAGLVERRSFYRRPLHTREILDLLAHRTPLMPAPPFPEVLPPDQVTLVRRATTSDLFVVRKEWRGYVADEIAEIRNVMAHENNQTRFVRIDESEVIDTSSSSTASTSETSSETSDESTFNEQSKREIDLAINAKGQVDITGKYGPTSLAVSAGFAADFSMKDSTERATQIAKKAIARAASKVETQTRQERTRRTLTRTELRQRHGIDNTSDDHVNGVYRWVSRIDRFQIWRYPDRLQLEFEIPEPGRYLLEQLSDLPARPAGVGKPPAFELPAGGITPENYLALASLFGASGLPEPPQPVTGVSTAIALMAKDAPTAPPDYWNGPILSQMVEVAVPPGYAATSVKANIEATPLHAIWHREMSDHVGYDQQETLHAITATVAVGDQMIFEKETGPFADSTNSIMTAGASSNHLVQYFDGHLHHAGTAQTLATPISLKVPISVVLVGAWSGNVGIELTCALTAQARAAWVQGVYDALRAAHDVWQREWRAEQAMAGTRAMLAERSPARNEELMTNEVRRHVISWLLGESPFRGRKAVPDRAGGASEPDNSPDIDIAAALGSASTIQFLEQALEWSNLAWVNYPYYWADRDRWSELLDLETIDPALGAFLRAGSIRVVVPARPGMSTAVLHWLTYRQPWLGGSCAPVPGEAMYISVAEEIRDQLMPPADGVPGESWEVALSTGLMWLGDKEQGLPRNALARLGTPPHQPSDELLADDVG